VRVAVLCLGLLLFVSGDLRLAYAQDSDDPDDVSGAFLPAASVFGPDWYSPSSKGFDWSPELFESVSGATYAGPSGSRIALYIFIARPSSIHGAWEAATKTFDTYRRKITDKYDYHKTEALKDIPPPVGCNKAKRFEGWDGSFGLFGALTMCAAEPNIILVAAVTGEVGGNHDHRASDAVVVTALRTGGSFATPTAERGG
jgi:hypothetical protein